MFWIHFFEPQNHGRAARPRAESDEKARIRKILEEVVSNSEFVDRSEPALTCYAAGENRYWCGVLLPAEVAQVTECFNAAAQSITFCWIAEVSGWMSQDLECHGFRRGMIFSTTIWWSTFKLSVINFSPALALWSIFRLSFDRRKSVLDQPGDQFNT